MAPQHVEAVPRLVSGGVLRVKVLELRVFDALVHMKVLEDVLGHKML